MNAADLDRVKFAAALAWTVEHEFNQACNRLGISTKNIHSALAELGELEARKAGRSLHNEHR